MDEDVLGWKWKDKITGYEGVATSITRFLNGCDRVGLEKLNDKGEVVVQTFDLPTLGKVGTKRVVDPAIPASALGTGEKPGGPHDHAPASRVGH